MVVKFNPYNPGSFFPVFVFPGRVIIIRISRIYGLGGTPTYEPISPIGGKPNP